MKPITAWHTRHTLLHRVRQQYDEKAWEEFVYYYRGYVYNIALRMGLSHHDIEEVVQNVMVKLWKKLPEFEYDPSRGRFRGWLCTVTSNDVKHFWQKKSRDPERLGPGEREELIRRMHEMPSTPSMDMAEEEWTLYVMTIAWKRVRPEFGEKERAVFEMLSKAREVEDIAKELGIATSSVYVYKKRVTDRLKKEVARLNRELD